MFSRLEAHTDHVRAIPRSIASDDFGLLTRVEPDYIFQSDFLVVQDLVPGNAIPRDDLEVDEMDMDWMLPAVSAILIEECGVSGYSEWIRGLSSASLQCESNTSDVRTLRSHNSTAPRPGLASTRLSTPSAQ